LPVSGALVLFAVIAVRRDGCSTYGNSCTPLAEQPREFLFRYRDFSRELFDRNLQNRDKSAVY
jgi:hypothetical protein